MASAALVDDFLETGGYTVSTGHVPVQRASVEELRRSLNQIERQVSDLLGGPKTRKNRYSIARLARLKREIVRELDRRGESRSAHNMRSKGLLQKRSHFNNTSGNWVKRDTKTGRFMDQKTSSKTPFKGVRKEK